MAEINESDLDIKLKAKDAILMHFNEELNPNIGREEGNAFKRKQKKLATEFIQNALER